MSGASSLKITGRLGSEGAVANVGFASGTSARVPHTPHTHVPPTHTHTAVTLHRAGKHTNSNQDGGKSAPPLPASLPVFDGDIFLRGLLSGGSLDRGRMRQPNTASSRVSPSCSEVTAFQPTNLPDLTCHETVPYSRLVSGFLPLAEKWSPDIAS